MWSGEIMSLNELCQIAPDRNFVEIILYYSPDKEEIKPWIYPLKDRLLTYDEWMECIALVTSWYSSMAPDVIDRHNSQWQQPPKVIYRQPESTKTRQKDGNIYILKGDRFYKIGQAVKIDSRIEQFSPLLPFPVEFVHSFATDNMDAAEKELHERFADKHTHGEWFALTEDDVAWLKTMGKAGTGGEH